MTVIPEETTNLFETPGQKQTATDFIPAPEEIATNFGTLEFVGGAFPTEESAQKIYDEMDLQHARLRPTWTSIQRFRSMES